MFALVFEVKSKVDPPIDVESVISSQVDVHSLQIDIVSDLAVYVDAYYEICFRV
jgi:hypothetical protein